jgi:exopolysaccharide biosynthesis polyprenyl glycosylphosphotransferase
VLKRHSRFFESLMLGADLLLVAAAWLGACLLRFSGFPIPLIRELPPWRPYLILLTAILLIWPIVFKAFGLYRPRRLSTRTAEVRDIARACTFATLLLIAVSFFLRAFEPSRLVFLYFWAFGIVALALARGAFREILRLLRRREYNLRFALVVGNGELAARLVAAVRRHPELGIRVMGLLAEGEGDGPHGLPVLGPYGNIGRVVAERGIDLVFVALPHEDFAASRGILDGLVGSPAAIKIIPDYGPLLSLCGTVEEFEGLPMVSLQDPALYGWNRVLKRGFDVAGSVLLLILLAPLLAAIALLVRCLDGRPVLYRQERMGLDGRRFHMLKFRTMRVDAEAETGPVWAVPDDPRRTRLGGLLRRLSLDELPQLWNVLGGEMSLVGPRPERPAFIEEFRQRVPQYVLRHKVKAGLTGWAQVNGWRGNTPVDIRTAYDLYYVEHWSLGLDLKILWRTLWQGLEDRNAY